MKKRVLSLLMAAALVLSLAQVGAFAAEITPVEPEASACICESKCTEGTGNENCPVCGEDWTKCAFTETQSEQSQENENPPVEQENLAPECNCTTKCAEGAVDGECPVCGEDWTKCAFTETQSEQSQENENPPAE